MKCSCVHHTNARQIVNLQLTGEQPHQSASAWSGQTPAFSLRPILCEPRILRPKGLRLLSSLVPASFIRIRISGFAFDLKQEPYEVMLHVPICARGARKGHSYRDNQTVFGS